MLKFRAVIGFLLFSWTAQAEDVVIYGGTAAGMVAAIQASRMGDSVVLLEPGKYLGGMTTGGLGATDLGDKHSLGGIAREFYRSIYDYYTKPEVWRVETREEYLPKHRLIYTEDMKTQWFFEPHVADKILRAMLEKAKVRIVYNALLDRKDGVKKEGTRITSIRTLDGKTYEGKMFIDTTYEGDLMAAAGVSYFVGREANAKYGETFNGVRLLEENRVLHVSPYVKEGDPSSGLLPRVSAEPPGAPGEEDHRVQAYNFRMCLTDDPANRVAITKPDGYDPLQYETMLRHLLGNPKVKLGEILFTLVPMPNRKTDSNNKNLFSTDFPGANYGWPEASYEEREKMLKEHRTYQQGMFWFLANDPRVPEAMRNEVAKWGLAKDEFQDNGNWPHQLYVREARRMVSDYVVTEDDCMGKKRADDSVGLASYGMDSHLVSLFVDDKGRLRLDGGFFRSVKPYPVSFRAIVPRKSECTNLLVPICLSASHVAYGSMRMEPVFMMLAQAAATAAALAIQDNTAVQDVPYAELRAHLLKDGMVIDAKSGAAPKGNVAADNTPVQEAIEKLAEKGVIEDKTYWLENVRDTGHIPGDKVAEVLIQSANKLQTVDSFDQAIDVLIQKKVLTAPEFWVENARTGKLCPGRQVGFLLQSLAKKLPQ